MGGFWWLFWVVKNRFAFSVGQGISSFMAKWRAAYCESRRELFARDGLLARGFEVFCPFERVTRRRRAGLGGKFRLETVDLPVFAPYLFVRTEQYLAVEQTPGVRSVVGIAGAPLEIPDRIIAKMQLASDAAGLVSARDITKISFSFAGKVGDAFNFKDNSLLRGLTARISSLSKLDESGELRVWVEMLGGEREISVPYTAVGSFIGSSGGPRVAASVGC